MSSAPAPTLTIWAVSDGRAGIEAQVVGLAEAVARQRPAEIAVKRINWRLGLGRLPWRLIPPWALKTDGPIGPPWPDIWIAAGRATLPLSTRMRRWSGGRSLVVQVQDPRTDLRAFDLVIPPAHDALTGENVFPILGSPNRLSADKLAAELARFETRLAPLPHPRIAVIIGGRSRAFDLPPARAADMAEEIAAAAVGSGGSLLVSFTRRTPEAARAILTRRLAELPGWIWDGTGDNPYFAFLAGADVILVTEDSTNLAADAAATGKPVHVLAMSGASAKFTRFHEDLRARGVARPFSGELAPWCYPPVDETKRAAEALLRRYDTHLAATRL